MSPRFTVGQQQFGDAVKEAKEDKAQLNYQVPMEGYANVQKVLGSKVPVSEEEQANRLMELENMFNQYAAQCKNAPAGMVALSEQEA